MVTSFEHVDVADDRGDAVLVAAASFEVGGQVRGVPEGAHLRGVRDEVRVAHTGPLVIFGGVSGDDLNIHVAQRDVGVVVVDVLHDRRAVRALRPLRGRHHVVVDPLVVPQAGLVRDPLVGVLGAENDLRAELPDDLVRVIDVVGVGVGAQVEREVGGGDAVVGHVAEHPVGVSERCVNDSLALGVARVGAVGGADALGAVDHGEDAARFEQDGVRRTRRRENMNAGGAIRAGEGVDLRVDAVGALLLGRGRGTVGGIGGVDGVGGGSAVRGRAILRGGRAGRLGIRP